MRYRDWLGIVCFLVIVGGCGDASDGARTPAGGGTADASAADAPVPEGDAARPFEDAAVDGAVPPDPGIDGSNGGFASTPGTQAAVDRTAPCQPGVDAQYRQAPEDGSIYQACLPNYDVWAPIACGEPVSKCPIQPCKPGACQPGEAAKPVGGQWCVCLNLCALQQESASCDDGKRRCIPVDDASGTQVFICGGPT
jgi:hypothetical protein